MIRRLQDRGFLSFHLAGESAEMGPLWRDLRQLDVAACGMRALETVRIEEGFPVIGLDITEKTLPQEVGRNEKAISFNKGCYLGQEIVARIDSRGAVNKVLSGIRFKTSDVPPAGGKLTHADQPVGQITSAAYSPAFGEVLPWPMLPASFMSLVPYWIRPGALQPSSNCRCARQICAG